MDVLDLKWKDGLKWNKKAGKIQCVCRLGPSVAIVIAINGMGRAEWRYGSVIGYEASVSEAKKTVEGLVVAKAMAKRMTR